MGGLATPFLNQGCGCARGDVVKRLRERTADEFPFDSFPVDCPIEWFRCCLTALLLLGGYGVCSCEPLQAQNSSSGYDLSGHMRGSVNRLQTFEEGQIRNLQDDARYEQEIQRLLPNYKIVTPGNSERSHREQALQALKTVELTSSGRQTANEITNQMSLYRRLPECRFEIEPETYDYFIGNPDVVVSLWQTMGISAINVRQISQYHYQMNNSDGTASDLYFIRRSNDSNIVYCDGQFKSPFLKAPISAKGLFCLYHKYEKQADGTTFVRHHADVFVSFPNVAVETAAKLIAPVSNYIADRNFQEISLFMHTMSLTMARQPTWVQEQAARLRGVRPDQAQQLMEVTFKNYQSQQSRMAARWSELNEPVRR